MMKRTLLAAHKNRLLSTTMIHATNAVSRRFAALALFALVSLPTHAALVVSSSAYTYSQTFDSLPNSGTSLTWTNDSTPLTGWNLFNSTGAAITTYSADSGNSNAGGFKSFGASTDRALGGIGAGTNYFGNPAPSAVAGWIAVSFANSTGSALSGFDLSFDGEQWRNGGGTNAVAQTMALQYGIGATFAGVSTWTAPGGNFDWTSPVATTTAALVDGNAAGSVAGRGGSVSLDWTAGSTLWIRWIENNDIGNDHALAIDNLTFSVSAPSNSNSVPVPSSIALLLAGVWGLGWAKRRQVRS
ncbi:hypothetical protein CKO12_12330 [Chromatium okenii]|uniref:PEP-CTERM sorting domain-containing protein n=1 Tax=Chromatium okenii TaxID=61644 RepID=UPI001A91264F|nr:PEP-CTERM sorting domain-containing protein [Chromatium okenii]MBK1642648.1 hypothetical protein [Chromatium okenii]